MSVYLAAQIVDAVAQLGTAVLAGFIAKEVFNAGRTQDETKDILLGVFKTLASMQYDDSPYRHHTNGHGHIEEGSD